MGSKGHGVGTTVQQLPRTTPHISSTHHRLVRQGHHQPPAATPLTPDRLQGPLPQPPGAPVPPHPHSHPHLPSNAAAASAAGMVALSNFRDASSSRSLTPHPFANNASLKKTTHNNPPLASGQSGGHVGAASSSSSDGCGRRFEYQSSVGQSGAPLTSSASCLAPAGRHLPPPQHFYQTGTAGFFGTRLGSHAKGASHYSSGGGSDGGGGRGGGGGGGGGRSKMNSATALSPVSTTSSGSNPSAAASFFARAAQKVSASSSKKKKQRPTEKEKKPQVIAAFPTNFSIVLLKNPPPVPRNLLRPIGQTQNALSGKVRVMLRVCPVEGGHSSSFLTIDAHRNQVTAFDPSTYGHSTSAYRRPLPPKMFGFDAVFAPTDPLSEICATSLVDILHAVVGGADGCLFCYGHARIGKTYTMVGDESPLRLGMIPSAISWLFRLINEQKEQTGARFSVRVSAVEVTGKQEVLKDLLADIASSAAESGSNSPGMYLREDPVCGTQLENQSELRAPTAERAAFFLDAAIAARTVPDVDEDARNSHLLFTIHVYQYRVETTNEGQNGVAGGRSRLHLIDFGSCSRNREGSALSLSALGTVIMALLNGQRHVPYRESTLTQLIKESLGSLSCHACMIVHVSPVLSAYNETLQVMQLATRLQRMRTKRRSKFSSTSSEDSSCDENARIRSRMRLGVRMGTLREGSVCSTDYTSSSEQSCDTVIYMGDNGQYSLSDRDITDCEGGASRGTAIPRPRFTPPSGLVKTSSLTRVEEVIEGRHHHSTPSSYSIPSPYGSLAQSQQSKSGKSRMHKFVRGFTDQELADNDLGKGKDVRSGSGRSIGGERWIDGPGSMFQNPGLRDSEQWVDGPPEFRMDTGRQDESSLVRSPAKVSTEASYSSPGNKQFVSGGGGGVGCVSRIPHKAARTAKIAMLFKREMSPTEEENAHHMKHSNGRVGQSETEDGQKNEEQIHSREEGEGEEEDESGGQNSSLAPKDQCISSTKLKQLQSDCMRNGVCDSTMLSTEESGGDRAHGETSSRSGGNVCEETGAARDEQCQSEAVVLASQVTETDIDVSHDQQEDDILTEKEDADDSRLGGYEYLTPDGIDELTCDTSLLLHSGQLIHEGDVQTSSPIPDRFERIASRFGTVPAEDAERETKGRERDASGEEKVTASQPRRSSALKLDIESLLLQNRESIYELQMDEELENGSRESLQRLIYGSSDDDSTVWNNSYGPPHSVDIVDEANPFLDALSLATFNDLLGQSGNHLLHVTNHESTDNTLLQLEAEGSSRDADGGQPDADSQVVEPAADTAFALEVFVSDDVACGVISNIEGDTVIASDTSLRSTYEDCAALSPQKSMTSNASNDCSLQLTTSVTQGLTPTAASTPIKPSSLRLPTGGRMTVSSKLPETTAKSSKKPPPTPRSSSLATGKKSQVTNTELTNTASEQTTTGTSAPQSVKGQRKSSSSAKDSSVKSGDEKESTGLKRLTTFGFKTPQPSPAKPSVPKTNGNNSTTNKKQSPVSSIAAPKIPVPVSPATSTKSAKQSRIALPSSSSAKKTKLSLKASSDICGRVEATTVVEKDGRLMSPYHFVTKPRHSVHSSSGHGSDGSSVVENRIVKSASKTSEVEVSSGYESMIRDSEVTGTSSSQDSNSECASAGGKGRGMKIFRKRAKGRSRSAPARWNPVDGTTVHVSRRQFVQSRLAIIGHHRSQWTTTDSVVPEEAPLEIKTFNSEDVERMSRWRKKEAEMQSLQERRCRIQELLTAQSTLKRNLARSKEILMVDRDDWSCDSNIAGNNDRDDPDYLLALEKETAILQKRIEACKSRIMIVTCFDVTS